MTVQKYSIYHAYYVMSSVPSKPDGVDWVAGSLRRYRPQARVRCSTESQRAQFDWRRYAYSVEYFARQDYDVVCLCTHGIHFEF